MKPSIIRFASLRLCATITLPFAFFLLTSCMSPRPPVTQSPSVLDGLSLTQTTPAGTSVLSASGLSPERLQTIDTKVEWCIASGLSAKPSDITIYVKDGIPDASGTLWITENGQRIGGRVISFKPIAILVMPNQLGCIRHELLHIHLYQTTGDPDANHTRPEWKIWPSYEETLLKDWYYIPGVRCLRIQ